MVIASNVENPKNNFFVAWFFHNPQVVSHLLDRQATDTWVWHPKNSRGAPFNPLGTKCIAVFPPHAAGKLPQGNPKLRSFWAVSHLHESEEGLREGRFEELPLVAWGTLAWVCTSRTWMNLVPLPINVMSYYVFLGDHKMRWSVQRASNFEGSTR